VEEDEYITHRSNQIEQSSIQEILRSYTPDTYGKKRNKRKDVYSLSKNKCKISTWFKEMHNGLNFSYEEDTDRRTDYYAQEQTKWPQVDFLELERKFDQGKVFSRNVISSKNTFVTRQPSHEQSQKGIGKFQNKYLKDFVDQYHPNQIVVTPCSLSQVRITELGYDFVSS